MSSAAAACTAEAMPTMCIEEDCPEVTPALMIDEDVSRRLISAVAVPDLRQRWRRMFGAMAIIGTVFAMAGVMMGPNKAAYLTGASNKASNISISIGLAAGGCGTHYDQCGGKTWGGTTCCEAGCACLPDVKNPEYYSSCTPTKGSNSCDAGAAHSQADAMLPQMAPLKAAAESGAKTKAKAAMVAAKEFAKAAAEFQKAAKSADEEAVAIEAVQKAAGEGLDAYMKAMGKAVSAANAQKLTGKAAWEAGDKALKAEAARIKVAMQGDDQFGKLQESAHKMGLWLGAR